MWPLRRASVARRQQHRSRTTSTGPVTDTPRCISITAEYYYNPDTPTAGSRSPGHVCLSDRGAFVFKTRPEMELVAPFVGRPFFVDHLLNIQLTLTGRAGSGRRGAAEWPERGRRYATGSLVPIHRRSQFIRPIRL